MYAILATAIEVKEEVKEHSIISKQNLKMGTDSLTISTETNAIVKESITMEREHFGMSKKILRLVQNRQRGEVVQSDGGRLGPNESKLGDSGARRGVALNRVKKFFGNDPRPAIRFRELQNLFVKDTFRWLDEEDSYKSFIEEDNHFLWVYGGPGLGKSCLAYAIIERLGKLVEDSPRTSIAYYFFREELGEDNLMAMLSSTAIMTAVSDRKYREEAAAEIAHGTWIPDDDDGTLVWADFFATKFPKDSEAKLFLVLDGLDEVDADGRAKLFNLLQQIREDELNIQVIITSRPGLESAICILEPVRIEITKAKISQKSGDLWRIIMARCKTLPRLKRLKSLLWKEIAVRLRKQADSKIKCNTTSYPR
jgi:hypothetical protein